MDPVFSQLLADLMFQSYAAAWAELQGGRRLWMRPTTLIAPPDTGHVEVAAAFSRSGLSAAAVAVTTAGTTGQSMAVRVQADYLSAAERAFRARHTGPIRCRTHAAARRMGHATTGAGPIARVGRYAQDLLTAGAPS